MPNKKKKNPTGGIHINLQEESMYHLLDELDEKEAENKILRDKLQKNDSSSHHVLFQSMENDLRATEQKLRKANQSNAELQAQLQEKESLILILQSERQSESRENEAACRTSQEELQQQKMKIASLEKQIANLQATVVAQEDGIKSKDWLLNETRQYLQETLGNLEIERERTETLRADQVVNERELHEMKEKFHAAQLHKDKSLENVVENLKRKVSEQEQMIADLQNCGSNMEEERDRLKEKLKMLKITFQNREAELEFSLHKTQDQLKAERDEHEASSVQMKEKLQDELRREKEAHKVTRSALREAKADSGKLRDSEECLRREVQKREEFQAKVSALEKSLDNQECTVRDLKAHVQKQKVTFSETVKRCHSKDQTLKKENGELMRKAEGLQEALETQTKRVTELTQALTAVEEMMRALQQEKGELSQALTTAEEKNRVLQEENEALQTSLRDSETNMERVEAKMEMLQEKKRQKSKWKFWSCI